MTTANGGRFQLHSRPLSYNSNILPDYFTPNHSTKAQSYGIRRYFQSARRQRREELELNRDETPHLQTYQAHAAWTSDHESVFPQLVQPNDTQHKPCWHEWHSSRELLQTVSTNSTQSVTSTAQTIMPWHDTKPFHTNWSLPSTAVHSVKQTATLHSVQ